MASAHPHKIVPWTAHCVKPCSVESATVASACACTAGTSRQNCETKAAKHRANARLKGCDSSCANVRAELSHPFRLAFARMRQLVRQRQGLVDAGQGLR